MTYEPAPLQENQISKLREYEHQLSQEAGAPVILIAYSEKDTIDNSKELHFRNVSVEKKRP